MGKSRKDILFEIHSKYVYGNETLIDDKFFIFDTFKQIGSCVIDKVVEEVEFVDKGKYQEICENGFNLTIESDFETDYAKGILELNYLPKDAIVDVKNEYGKLMFEYSEVNSMYSKQLTVLHKRATEIKNEKGNYKNKINQAIRDGRNYSVEYKERYNLILTQELINTEIDKLDYSIRFLKTIIDKLTNTKLKKIAIKSCIKNRMDEDKSINEKILGDFTYYREMIEITKNHIKPRDFDLASVVVKSTKIYDKAMDKLRLKSYQYNDSEIPQELINEERAKVQKVRDFFATNDINITEVQNYINGNDVVGNIKNIILNTYCLKDRNPIIEAIELFESGKFELFVNIILVQIEGLLDDIVLGLDMSNEKKFSNLRDKVELLFGDSALEYYKYLYYDLNSMRNQIAHGNESDFYFITTSDMYRDDLVSSINTGILKKRSFESVACSLLFDLQAILHSLVDKTEEKRIIKFVKWQYKLICKGVVNSEKLSGLIEAENFKEISKWIINKRFDEIYSFYSEKNDDFDIVSIISQMRDILLTSDVWQRAAEKYKDEDYLFFKDKVKRIQHSLNIVTQLKIQGFDEELEKIRQIRKDFNKSVMIN